MAWSAPVTGGKTGAKYGDRGPRWAKTGGMHTGLDFVAPKGAPVHAVDDGTVIYAQRSGTGYGNLVKIRHAGVDSWYAHLSSIDVKVLTKVKRGAQIGRVGDTGNATGPHLHLEARVALGAAHVDPAKYLGGLSGDPGSTSGVPESEVGRLVPEINIPGLSELIDFAGGIKNLFAFITDTKNWARVGLFLGGGVLIALGLYTVFQTQIDNVVGAVGKAVSS